VKVYLDKIGYAADRMFSMIEGVLNYSKLGNKAKSSEIVDLNEIINQIESDLELLIHRQNAEIKIKELPKLQGDRVLLYQLFYNLILDSLKFSRSGVSSLIEIRGENIVQDGQDFYKIILSDNGIGFEADYEDAIFETFTRLNPIDEYEGTGLGLALCKKIVERHKGSISASGQPGKGATFTILLPV